MLPAISYGLTANSPVAISDPSENRSETSWDTLRRSYLLQLVGVDIDTALTTHFPDGGAHPSYSNMKVIGTKKTDEGGGCYAVEVEWKGWMADKGYRRVKKNFGEVSTGENISSGLGAPYPSFMKKVKVEQPLPSVETTYFQVGEPSTTEVKKEVGTLPGGFPALPTAPTQIWTSITDPTYVYPSGWILDDRNVEPLHGTDLYKVTDRHVFRFATEM